ncbi:MFS transporter [Pseudomonas sp. nanlin1]|uniref:MFS transporter n=1 Tax=Pseudomonas sp. nanlin1 TaxID=3040605 RepID=UPI003890A815
MKRIAERLLPGATSKRLCIYNFFVMFSVERGVFVFYLQEYGYGMSEISWLQVVFSMSLFLFELPSGTVADVYGRAAALVLGGCLMSISLIGQYAAIGNIYAMGAFFILQAIAFSLISGSLSALLYGFLQAEGNVVLFARVYAVIQFAGSLSLGLAMIIAGALVRWGGWPAVYTVACVSPVIGVLFILFILKKEKMARHAKRPTINVGIFFSEVKRIAPFAFPFAMMHAAMTPYFLYASAQFQSMGIDLASASTAVGFAEILCAAGVAILIRKVPAGSQGCWAFLMLIFAVFMFFQFLYGPLMAIAAFVLCNALVLWLALASHQFINACIEANHLRATTLSAVSFLEMLLISIGFTVYGYVADHYSRQLSLQVLAFFPLGGAIMLMGRR